MKRPLAGLRLGVMLLFVVGLLSPVASTGAGAQDLTCDDFNSQRAAQAVLDADPSLEDALDPDGDGVACNEDEGGSTGDDETPVDEETPEDEETPADDDSGSEDGDAYLADIQGELDTLSEQIDRFLEIDSLGADATEDDVNELNEIAAEWVDYPDVAAEYTAPAGYEDVGEAYLDLADSVGEMGQLWEEYWATESGSTEEDEALDAFNEVFIGAQDQILVVQDLIDEAGGGGGGTDDPTEEASSDDEFLGAIQDELDTLSEQTDRFIEISESGSDATDEDIDELNQIAEDWANYPNDVAAEIAEPEEADYADAYEAYLDLADTYGAAGEAWGEYWAAEVDSPEEEEARDAFDTAFADAQDQLADLQDMVDELGGGGGGTDDPSEDPTEEATEEPTDGPNGGDLDADAEAYLTSVQETADDWNASITRFNELIGLGADRTEADTQELADIVLAWGEAPDIAADAAADMPDGYEDVQEAYEGYANALGDASGYFTEWINAEAESAESEEALSSFILALADAQAQYDTLTGLLADAGL